MTRRRPYPRVTVSGPAASELLTLATRWGMTPDEVVVRLSAEAGAYRTASTVVSVGAALLGSVLAPSEKPNPSRDSVLDAVPPHRRIGP
jgi:hypothetical protein